MRRFLSLVMLLLSVDGFAAVKTDGIQALVEEYYAGRNPFLMDEQCYPKNDCVDVVCENLGSLGCDDSNEVDEVLRMCRGQYDGDCIRVSCRLLGSFDCDDRREVSDIAGWCVGNRGGYCVESVCERLGSFGCDDPHEIKSVAQKCAGQ